MEILGYMIAVMRGNSHGRPEPIQNPSKSLTHARSGHGVSNTVGIGHLSGAENAWNISRLRLNIPMPISCGITHRKGYVFRTIFRMFSTGEYVRNI